MPHIQGPGDPGHSSCQPERDFFCEFAKIPYRRPREQINEARLLYDWRTKGISNDSIRGRIRPTRRSTPLSTFPAGFLPHLQPKDCVGTIKDIRITGLPDDEWKLDPLIVRLVSTVLTPQGRIGVGRGLGGTQYYEFRIFYHNKEFECMTREPEIEWIKPEGIESWIRKNGYINRPYEMHDWMAELFSQGAYDDPFIKGWA